MNNLNNMEIRKRIAARRLRHYEVAEACGVSSYTFSHWLQTEMSPDKKERVLKAIESIIIMEETR